MTLILVFEKTPYTLPTAYAHRRHAIAKVAPFHFVDERDNDARAIAPIEVRTAASNKTFRMDEYSLFSK